MLIGRATHGCEVTGMIDTANEDIFLLSRGTIRLRSRPSTATLWRWAMKGIRGVKLDTVVIGGRRYTSVEAFDRFTLGLNADRGAATPSGTRLRAKEKADAARRASVVF